MLFPWQLQQQPGVMQGGGAWRGDAAYLVGVPLLREDVPDESLLHFLLLHQELPQTLDGQRRVVARPGANTVAAKQATSRAH